MTETREETHMRAALALARRGLGNVWPNPAVGCVLVREDLDGRVVGRGWTQPGGRPHAETEALRRAGEYACGAVAYVTLEPCDHVGETPPCSAALIEAGVKRVVVAVTDPDPRVSGLGVARLENAGIAVESGLCGEEARDLNRGFFLRVEKSRPLVAWKTATSLDGKTATATGHSQWITGDHARRRGHLFRARFDAILVGSETAIADEARLTCRIPGLEGRSPVRVVLDSRLRLPLDHPLVETASEVPTWIYAADGAEAEKSANLTANGVRVTALPAGSNGGVDIQAVVADLAANGITRLLVEGGSRVAGAFLEKDLVDRIFWFRGSQVIGGDGLPACAPLGIGDLSDTTAFTRRATWFMGADQLEILER